MHIKSWFNYSILAIGFATMSTSCASKKLPTTTTFYQKYQYTSIDSNVVTNNDVSSFLGQYTHRKDSIMNEVIGYSEVPLTKKLPESTAGNFMADAQLEGARKLDPNVQIAVINYGSIRTNYIAGGDIPLGSIYEIMPFDNMLTIMEIPGDILQTFCDHMADRGGWPIAGLSYEIKDNKAINIKVSNKALNESIIYKVALSDYLSTGGDECEFLEGLKKVDHSVFIRDLLINYVKEHKTIHPQIQNRIQNAK